MLTFGERGKIHVRVVFLHLDIRESDKASLYDMANLTYFLDLEMNMGTFKQRIFYLPSH